MRAAMAVEMVAAAVVVTSVLPEKACPREGWDMQRFSGKKHDKAKELGSFRDSTRSGKTLAFAPCRVRGKAVMQTQQAHRELSRAEVVDQLRALGVAAGGVLLVHTSFRAVRPVAGGPLGLIAALREALGTGGTLVMPSMTGDDEAPFDPLITPAASDLGVVADTFRCRPDVVRSDHPFAFAAAGPCAAHITADPLPVPPHLPASPVGRVHDLGGQVLLLGVGHDANTTLHLAELVASVPYRVPRHCTVLRDGCPVRIDYGENDHCCARFALADDWLRAEGLLAEGPVGHAHARLMRSRDIVRAAVAALARDPLVFLHHADVGCLECDAARSSITADGQGPG